MFSRPDWRLFTNMGTLGQKAGVPVSRIRRLVLKELVDNALDASGSVTFGKEGDGTYWVEDRGPGIPGDAESIARLFSLDRPLTTTKIVRLPMRGALGNGLRVVVGAVVASGGQRIRVATRGMCYDLAPRRDGRTEVVSIGPSAFPGTRITVELGEGAPEDEVGDELAWARLAQAFSGQRYEGKTSAYWYDEDSFFDLLQAAGEWTVGEILERFHGFGRARGEKGPETAAGPLVARTAATLTPEESTRILGAMRRLTKPIPAKRIGKVGAVAEAYRKTEGALTIRPGSNPRGLAAELPFVVEAWAWARDEDDDDTEDAILGYVNGTPITGSLAIDRRKLTAVAVFGCGLHHKFDGVSRRPFTVCLNITVPYMPITTDGKEPDLSRFVGEIGVAMKGATRKLKAVEKKASGIGSQKDTVLANLEDAIHEASDGGTIIFSQRQLFYSVRPYVLDEHDGAALSYDHFQRIITEYENTVEDLGRRGMYRDPRGVLYHPHLRHEIPLGTVAVDRYTRPEWTFNKILYIEKKGLIATLRATGWPERNDCALMSSEGFATRAVRDVLDLLGDTDEEITFYCVHDADSSGTLIYQALQEGTPARARRRVRIVNLGLEPWEGVAMGLQEETFREGKGRRPVARYVRDQTYEGVTRAERFAPDGSEWEDWLQTHRIELNAMQSREFVRWLDEKMRPHDVGKVIPPRSVLNATAEEAAAAELRRRAVESILAEHDVDAIVSRGMVEVEKRMAGVSITDRVREGLEADPAQRWTHPVHQLVAELAPDPARLR